MEEKVKIELETNDCNFKVLINDNYLADLILTCSAFPEQYEMVSLLDKHSIASFRLRFGVFSVRVKEESVLTKKYQHEFKGYFHEEERVKELLIGVEAVIDKIRNKDVEENPYFICECCKTLTPRDCEGKEPKVCESCVHFDYEEI